MAVNKIKLVISLILCSMIISIMLPVKASSLSIDDMWNQGNDFIQEGKSSDTPTFEGTTMRHAIRDLYNFAMVLAIIITAIIATYLGIQFMTQGTEGKAKVKEALVPLIIGAIVVFGSFMIWRQAMILFRNVEQAEKDVGVINIIDREQKIA